MNKDPGGFQGSYWTELDDDEAAGNPGSEWQTGSQSTLKIKIIVQL